MNNQKKNNQILTLLGFAAGAAAGWWLNTDQGRAWRKNSSNKLNQWGQDMSEKATEGAEVLQESIKQTLDQGQNYVTQASSLIREKIDSVSGKATETVTDTENSFKKGMEKAKNDIY